MSVSSLPARLPLDVRTPARLSRELRLRRNGRLPERRRVVALALGAAGSMALVSLYQTGLLRHLPEPPLPGFDADAVDASPEAYQWLSVPDGLLGLASYAGTALLAAAGGADRARRRPWLPLALAVKATADAAQAARLTKDQITRHGALCFWCLLAAGATAAILPPAFAEARDALATLRGR